MKLFYVCFFLYQWMVLGFDPRTLGTLGQRSTIELQLQLGNHLFLGPNERQLHCIQTVQKRLAPWARVLLFVVWCDCWWGVPLSSSYEVKRQNFPLSLAMRMQKHRG